MEATIADTTRLFQQFKAAYEKNDSETSEIILSQLKVKLTELPRLLSLFKWSPSIVQELLLANAVVMSVKIEDQGAFERHFLQLKPYYTELELLPPVAHDHTCIKHAVELQSCAECTSSLCVPHGPTCQDCQDHPNWEIRGTRVYFQKVIEFAPCTKIPFLQLINQTLGCARELEQIV